jgi:hypothetical protein
MPTSGGRTPDYLLERRSGRIGVVWTGHFRVCLVSARKAESVLFVGDTGLDQKIAPFVSRQHPGDAASLIETFRMTAMRANHD